jgi:hypothetical protein
MDGACVLGVGALCTVYRMCRVENLGVGVPGLPGTLAQDLGSSQFTQSQGSQLQGQGARVSVKAVRRPET